MPFMEALLRHVCATFGLDVQPRPRAEARVDRYYGSTESLSEVVSRMRALGVAPKLQHRDLFHELNLMFTFMLVKTARKLTANERPQEHDGQDGTTRDGDGK